MDLRWPLAALSASCTLLSAAPAVAQSTIVGPTERPSVRSAPRVRAPEFRVAEGDLRRAGEPRRSGLIAAVPINRDLHIGIGRFRVTDMARPRTHTENGRSLGAVPRERSIAGIGFSLRFD